MMLGRQYLFNILEIEGPDRKVTNKFERFMFIIILLNVTITILETVKSIRDLIGPFFHLFDVFSLLVFTGEYLARISVCTLDKRYSSFFLGRVRYMLTPYMLIDLLIIIPFYLPLFFSGIDTRFMLVFRMLRIARVLKLTRYSQSLQRILRVITKKKDDLIASIGVVFVLLIISASLMYYAEHGAQPEKFSSIPAAMWWGVATLTTVGYGDVFPVTNLGKFIGSFIAILGIGMVALPTGIIGSGFLEEINCKNNDSRCPHCGEKLNE